MKFVFMKNREKEELGTGSLKNKQYQWNKTDLSTPKQHKQNQSNQSTPATRIESDKHSHNWKTIRGTRKDVDSTPKILLEKGDYRKKNVPSLMRRPSPRTRTGYLLRWPLADYSDALELPWESLAFPVRTLGRLAVGVTMAAANGSG